MTEREKCPETPGNAFQPFARDGKSPLETRRSEECRVKRQVRLSEVLTPEDLPQIRQILVEARLPRRGASAGVGKPYNFRRLKYI